MFEINQVMNLFLFGFWWSTQVFCYRILRWNILILFF